MAGKRTPTTCCDPVTGSMPSAADSSPSPEASAPPVAAAAAVGLESAGLPAAGVLGWPSQLPASHWEGGALACVPAVEAGGALALHGLGLERVTLGVVAPSGPTGPSSARTTLKGGRRER